MHSETTIPIWIHIRKEYNELRKVGALTIQQSNIAPQMNNIQEPVNAPNLSNEISNELQNTIVDVIMPLNQASEELATTPPVHQVNNTTAQDHVMHLTKMVQVLQDKVDKLTKPAVPPKSIYWKTGKPWNRYCHTYGCCNHWGQNCTAKGPNHKDEATFQNRMGGSNFMCLPVTN